MPNHHVAWIKGWGGNPTMHPMVGQIIQDVQSLQTKGKGRKSNDKCPYHEVEWQKDQDILQSQPDFENKWKL
jgi:hypothetical protein